MLNISEEYINSIAPNQNAILNGWGLVKKNSFVKYSISTDENLIFGECRGSGESNYITSADFINPESPVFRCTCPSRQFPCKHAMGLMYAYINGKKFDKADIPEDIAEKRIKAEKREEKKKDKTTDEQPKKVNKNALIKKIQTQRDGLDLLEKITFNLAQSGLGTFNARTLQMLEEQVKQLGNYYIPGAQIALRELIVLFANADDPEKIYTEAVDCLTRVYSFCKKGREYLDKKLNEPDLSHDTVSTLDEWLGHAWQLSELKELGFVQNDIELAQLSFNSYEDEARQEYVDAGIWVNLKDGQVLETRNYRPYKAVKYIREDDSFYSIVQTKELFVYPGDMNPRIRWESMSVRDINKNDYLLIKSYAYSSYQEIIKLVKNQIKNPLSSKYPLALLLFEKIGMVDGKCVMEGTNGQRITLEDMPGGDEPASIGMLEMVSRKNLSGQAMLVRFHNDMDSKRLYAKPLSIISEDGIIRLVY